METFVNVNEKTIRLAVDYSKGKCVYLYAVQVELTKFGYSCNPLQGKRLCEFPMARKNQKKINAFAERVLNRKDEIARLFAEGKIEEAKTFINVILFTDL